MILSCAMQYFQHVNRKYNNPLRQSYDGLLDKIVFHVVWCNIFPCSSPFAGGCKAVELDWQLRLSRNGVQYESYGQVTPKTRSDPLNDCNDAEYFDCLQLFADVRTSVNFYVVLTWIGWSWALAATMECVGPQIRTSNTSNDQKTFLLNRMRGMLSVDRKI